MSSKHSAIEQHLEEEESYFVSMTDMMVGMLFVFIIMLMSFALNLREAEHTQQTINKQLTGAEEVRKQLLQDIQQSLEQAGIQVKIDNENGILRLPEDILFDSGQAVLKPEGLHKMQVLVDTLAKILPCYAYATTEQSYYAASCPSPHKLEAVFIEGHTDNIPLNGGRYKDNWELSAARAINTYRFLVDHSSPLATLDNQRREKLLSVSSYGEFRPVQSNTTEEGRKANRRIDLRFLMATPKPEELKTIEQHL